MSIGPAREGYCNKHRIHRKPCLVCAAEATPPPPSETGATAEERQIEDVIYRLHNYCDIRDGHIAQSVGNHTKALLAGLVHAAKRSAHLEDARAGCPKLKNPPRKRSKRPPGGQK
jgi:hypothetical protein